MLERNPHTTLRDRLSSSAAPREHCSNIKTRGDPRSLFDIVNKGLTKGRPLLEVVIAGQDRQGSRKRYRIVLAFPCL